MLDQSVTSLNLENEAGGPAIAAMITSIREFLAFKLGVEEYGIVILRVQENRSYEQPTRMVNTPDFIKGVINLRGVIVPIVDMRVKFNLSKVYHTDFTVVIVLTIGHQIFGMVVDGVSDVVSLTPERQRPVQQLNSTIGSDHILAIGSMQGRMLILLDIVKLMSSSSSSMGLVSRLEH